MLSSLLLLSSIAFASSECPVLTGTYHCDERVPGYSTLAISSEAYDEGRKLNIGVTTRLANGELYREGYLPDEGTQYVKLPNGGTYKAGDRCEKQALIRESVNSGTLPNGHIRTVRDVRLFGFDSSLNLLVNFNHQEFLDDKVVREHPQVTVCLPDQP
ncbi:MAG: hypothetical protein ACXWQO_13330 [Bdellovibrionota bacterium]